ncbi:MAG: HAD family hydrolase [Planctomycetota bacterium]|mgnify:CR=1 FL=1|nr:MAG: HAD family hydrolase [Planctomycetota bacterium]REJ96639.1 MAG: HAD family hydrolase [Planctomycetota bacterium]REK20076.1 MAG: HAD family hydrolase [Planctomycetota bacterium]REK28365.1 MAG: HAD family hydrolase [Planctomycetota bacterium]
MTESLVDVIRAGCRPMEPIPTGYPPRVNPLPGVRAVLFDIYGTMLISGVGDISLQESGSNEAAFREALIAAGLTAAEAAAADPAWLQQTIERHKRERSATGVESPEVDIEAVWAGILSLIELEQGRRANVDVARLAVEYECRVNPVWPMPGLVECLERLRAAGLRLGVISNAQAMTPLLFDALLGRSLENLGFDPELLFYSYRFGESKPGPRMFAAAVDALGRMGISPDEAVFVGNDMLNDVWGAARHQFRTVLFAGDRRSLRLREGDSRVQNLHADVVIVDSGSLCDCVGV